MIWNLMADGQNGGSSTTMILVVVGVILVMFVVMTLFNSRRGKQNEKEYTEQMDAIQPGHKVKTIGGICGIVKEVCDDNTVIVETGSEASGKSFVKMDKACIAQTDAKGPTQLAREEAEARRAAEKAAKKKGAGKAAADETSEAEEKTDEKPE